MRRRTYFIAGLILALCLSGCQTTTRVHLSSWDAFQGDMLTKYNSISKLKAEHGPASLYVNCYYGDISDDDMDALKSDLKSFLSSEKFLAEYVPYANEKADKNRSNSGLMKFMPNIVIYLYPNGSTKWAWASDAMYYTQPYRSDRVMEIDNYQTWSDWDYSE